MNDRAYKHVHDNRELGLYRHIPFPYMGGYGPYFHVHNPYEHYYGMGFPYNGEGRYAFEMFKIELYFR